MTRSTTFALVGILSLASITVLSACDSPGGTGDRWSCATAYLGTAEGNFFGEDATGTLTALATLRVFENGIDDVDAEPGAEVWIFEGEFEQIEGPLGEDQKVRGFKAVIDDDGSLIPVVEDREEGSNFAMSGSIDLDGDCTAEGTWDFTGESEGTWQARP